MWSQTKYSGINLPEVHGVSKSLDPNAQPEKQTVKPSKVNKVSQVKPRTVQGRAGLRRKKPQINQPISQSAKKLAGISWGAKNRKGSHKYTQFCSPCATNK